MKSKMPEKASTLNGRLQPDRDGTQLRSLSCRLTIRCRESQLPEYWLLRSRRKRPHRPPPTSVMNSRRFKLSYSCLSDSLSSSPEIRATTTEWVPRPRTSIKPQVKNNPSQPRVVPHVRTGSLSRCTTSATLSCRAGHAGEILGGFFCAAFYVTTAAAGAGALECGCRVYFAATLRRTLDLHQYVQRHSRID